MKPSRSTIVLAAVLTLAVAAVARGELTYDEAVCEAKTAVASWGYFQKKLGCLVSCQRGVRSGSIDPAQCTPPYPPSPTYGCIQGKQGRANGSICSACGKDAPECYAEVCPDTTQQWLSLIDVAADGTVALIYCDDSGSADGLTPIEGRCQDTIAKYSAKAAYARARCFAKCRTNELKGVVPSGSCTPPTPSDLYTQACLAKVDTTTAYRIDRYCTPPYGDAPECVPLGGADWAAVVGLEVDSFDPGFYCEN